jgi:hypothetical protein
MEKKIHSSKKVLIIGMGVVMLAAIAAAGFFYYQNTQLKQTPQLALQEETADLVEKVSKLVVLPEGETPTIATVSDPEALKDQIFFAQAEKGDKVLIYTNAKKAVLFSVVRNKILNVAPLNIGSTN